MSKLYCEIPESARRTVPTARAHDAGTVRIKNWKYAVEARMIDRGGGDSDSVTVTIRNLETGSEHIVFNATLASLNP